MNDTSKPQSDSFYRAFEDRFRGSRELIRSRLNAYLPLIEPLKTLDAKAHAVDLGCGRGEWLELLGEAGFIARGVDLDEHMLSACRDLGLDVVRGDAIAFLRALPEGSQVIVSGFHIAEHLPFDTLRVLIAEAKRILKPGGLLILETPNPENIKVGTASFYLDPTHERPLPPGLLSFTVEWTGFARVKVLRLNEAAELGSSVAASFDDVLGGVSPDYAVLGQKAADPATLSILDAAFSIERGLTLDALGDRYDQYMLGEAGAKVRAVVQAELAIELKAQLTGVTRGLEAQLSQHTSALEATIIGQGKREAALASAYEERLAASDALRQREANNSIALEANLAACNAFQQREGEKARRREFALRRLINKSRLRAEQFHEDFFDLAAQHLVPHMDRQTAELEIKASEISRLQSENQLLREGVEAMRRSTFWRMTGPARFTVTLLRRLVRFNGRS